VVGGTHQRATGAFSSIGGGFFNTVGGSYGVVGGGYHNTVSGSFGCVPGGYGIANSGYATFVCGNSVTMTGDSSFLFSDGTYPNSDGSAGPRRFIVIASGGSVVYSSSNVSTGVTLAAGGGAWNSVSDSTTKRNRRDVDTKEILGKISQLPIERWSYKTQDPTTDTSARWPRTSGKNFMLATTLSLFPPLTLRESL